MVELDIDRARQLLNSARMLFSSGDHSGVAGLAYQAFESATMALLHLKNGKDKRSHMGRRKRAKEILTSRSDIIDRLWEIRNIDFYGNTRVDECKREVSEDEIRECLEAVEHIVEEIELILQGDLVSNEKKE